MCPCEESTDEPTQSETSITDQGRLRWGFKQHPRQGVNAKSTWPGCEVKPVGDLSLLQYHSHRSHTHPWIVIADDRWLLCGGDPPPMTVRRNHFSRPWVQRWKGRQLQAIKPSQLDDFCSANNCLQEGSKGVAEQGELQGGTLNAPSYPTASQTDPKGLYFTVVSFFQVALLPDPSVHQWMSGVTMLVRWLCSSPASERLLWWVCQPRSSPASENAPLGKRCT